MNIELPTTDKSRRAMRPAVIETLESRQLLSAGLSAQYFSDAALTNAAFTRTDPAIHFNWTRHPDPALPGDFSVRWTGQITAPATGNYTFRDRASDGVRLWVNESLIINDWKQHNQAVTHAAHVVLQAGQSYTFEMDYFHDRGPDIVSLAWSAPHLRSGVIPATAFSNTTSGSPNPKTPPAQTSGGSTANSTTTGLHQSSNTATGTNTTTTTGTTTITTTTTTTTTTHTTTGIAPTVLQPPSTINWSGPIVITKGGTYSGNWRSLNANTPAVDIETSQPVIIINSNIESMSTLISAQAGGANVTVKDTNGWALNPNRSGQSPGRFLDAENFSNLDIENNSMVGTAGIEMGFWQGGGTVKILYNNALNIDGRWSNGNGGFDTGPDQNDLVQFAQFNHCIGMSGVEIAWNCVINQPGQSRVEDNISVFQTSGTSSSPILIHDNYIDGAYPVDPANDSSFSGGGIMLSDGWTGSSSTDTGNVQAYNNFVIDTENYGLAISSGRNDVIYNNTVISSGLLPNGQKEASQNVGIYIWNQGDPNFANGQEYGNTIGWMANGGGQNDSWTPNGSGQTGDTTLPGTITLAQQQSYYGVWAQKVSGAGLTIGAS